MNIKELLEIIHKKEQADSSINVNKAQNSNESEKLLEERVVDGVLGFAVGDALGVPVEFTPREERRLHPVTEMLAYGSHPVPEGTFSDDTSMMIATMDSIANKKTIDYDDIMNNFISWVRDAEYTATGELFDIGITTRKALSNYASGRCSAIYSGLTGERDNGNGSLMRILPIAYYLAAGNFTDQEEKEIIDKTSGLTHAHEISCLGCRIYCDYVKELLQGKSKEEAYDVITKKDYSKDYSADSLKKYERVLSGELKTLQEPSIQSGGFVVHTLEASLWVTLNSSSYEEATAKAVNLGSDTDTTGAVAGSLNGIIYGKENIPKRWLDKLRRKDYLENLSNRFSNQLEMLKVTEKPREEYMPHKEK